MISLICLVDMDVGLINGLTQNVELIIVSKGYQGIPLAVAVGNLTIFLLNVGPRNFWFKSFLT